jgi:hypothetical protein
MSGNGNRTSPTHADLTGAQRKAYAGEIGGLITKLSQDYDTTSRHEEWFKDFVKASGIPYTTLIGQGLQVGGVGLVQGYPLRAARVIPSRSLVSSVGMWCKASRRCRARKDTTF